MKLEKASAHDLLDISINYEVQSNFIAFYEMFRKDTAFELYSSQAHVIGNQFRKLTVKMNDKAIRTIFF